MKIQFLLWGFFGVMIGGQEAWAQSVPVAKKAASSAGTELFVGVGSVGWLPRNSLLPGGREVEAMARKLGARSRNVDAFGLRTFPVEADAAVSETAATRPAARITLNQALQTLRVSGINLERREFLLGARNVFQGDALELSFKNEVFVAEVVAVTATQILFRDRRREETGVLSHNLVQHLVLEPLQKRPKEAGLQGKVTPMEPIKYQRP